MKKRFAVLILALVAFVCTSAQAEGIVLPDPSFYFDRACTGGVIEFDAYPQAEFRAYVSLLLESYGMEIVDKEASERYEVLYLEAPGAADSRIMVCCFTNSQQSGIELSFGKGVTFRAMETYTPVEATAAPILGSDGLRVQSPEQYLGIAPCTKIYQEGNYYAYKYNDRGFERYGDPCDEWDAMQDYLNALVDSGYYEVIEHTVSKSKKVESWSLGYTGSGSVRTFSATKSSAPGVAILIQSHYGHIYVSYSLDIITDDLDETQARLGETINTNGEPDDPPSDEAQRCLFCNNGSCKECGGSGFVYGYSAYEKNWREKKYCSSCLAGRCIFCGGDGWR